MYVLVVWSMRHSTRQGDGYEAQLLRMTASTQHSQSNGFLKYIISKVEFLLYDGARVLYFGSKNTTLISQLAIIVKNTGKILVVDQSTDNINKLKLVNSVIEFQLAQESDFFSYSYNIIIIEDSVQAIPNGIRNLLIPGGVLFAPVQEKPELLWYVVDKNENGDVLIHKDNEVVKNLSCGKSFVESLTKTENGVQFKQEQVAKLLHCSLCSQVMTTPTYTCEEGHVIGAECKSKFDKCPTCHKEYTPTRFLRLDNILNELYTSEEDHQLTLDRFSEGVSNLLECPVCFDVMKPPTVTCMNGHTVGAECKNSLMICPACRGEFSNIKFTGLDNILFHLYQKCLGYKKGCRKKIMVKDIEEHESSCKYVTTVQCPFSICMKLVPEALFMNHVRRAHRTFIGVRQGFPLSVNPFFDIKAWTKLSLCRFLSEALSNTLFNFYILRTDENLAISVQFIGPTCQINRFSVTYRLSCGAKSLIRTGKPLPYNLSDCSKDSESSVFKIDKKTCLKTFRKGTLQIFVSVDLLPAYDTR